MPPRPPPRWIAGTEPSRRTIDVHRPATPGGAYVAPQRIGRCGGAWGRLSICYSLSSPSASRSLWRWRSSTHPAELRLKLRFLVIDPRGRMASASLGGRAFGPCPAPAGVRWGGGRDPVVEHVGQVVPLRLRQRIAQRGMGRFPRRHATGKARPGATPTARRARFHLRHPEASTRWPRRRSPRASRRPRPP